MALLLYDCIYLLASLLFYGASGWAATIISQHAGPTVVALPAAVLGFLLSLIALAAVACALLPRLEPGAYEMMKGKVFYGWVFRSLVRRILWFGPLKTALFSLNVLRFLSLRAQGARVAFNASFSSDVEVLDPALLEVGAGAIVGARCFLSGHWVADGRLVLDRIVVGPQALLAADVGVMPGVRIGARAFVEPQAGLGRGTVVGDGARIGRRASLDLGAQVEPGARIAAFAVIRSTGATESAERPPP